MKQIENLLAVARGDKSADFAVTGAQVFNSFTGAFEPKDILVVDGYIAALTPWGHEFSSQASEQHALKDHWLVPGFIDAHVHIESSMLRPEAFCALVAQNGVTTVIADPHEIANVLGTQGIDYMLAATEEAAARVFFMVPSCVPASALGSAAWTLTDKDIHPYFGHPRILGLAELMNYPGVVNGAPDVMAKMTAVQEYNENHFGPLRGLAMDGHAPFMDGLALQAYAAGVRSDHEASTVEEAKDRLEAGMALMMREGSAAKNLLHLVPAVNEYTAHLCLLCTDDRHPEDILREGSINFLVKKLVEDGRLPLSLIINMASYNTARHFSLRDSGAIAPGHRADFAAYPDLQNWRPRHVWNKGRQVVKDAKATPFTTNSITSTKADTAPLRGRVILASNVSIERLQVTDTGKPVKTIDIVPGQLVTEKGQASLPVDNGFLQADASQDIAKLVVFERHRESGRVAVGFLRGLGLQKGAIASTVAHDAHNLVIVGMNDDDIFMAAQALKSSGGGLALVNDGQVIEQLPLPLAGIFTDSPIEELCVQMDAIKQKVAALMTESFHDPFMTLAFMTLDVIPHIKLTDSGLVDVDAFEFTSLFVG